MVIVSYSYMKVTIRKRVFELEFFKEQLASSRSLVTFAKALGFNYTNGKLNKNINDIISELKLSTDHFGFEYVIKYPFIKKICPVCNIEFETQLGHRYEKTTCSSKCSNTYFSASKHTEKANLKRSISLKKNFKENQHKELSAKRIEYLQKLKTPKEIRYIKCLTCSNDFHPKNSKQIYCSRPCVIASPAYR